MKKAALQLKVPSLGIASDIEVVADAGTIGKYYSRARDTVLLVGIVLSTESVLHIQSIQNLFGHVYPFDSWVGYVGVDFLFGPVQLAAVECWSMRSTNSQIPEA